jgi:drug/metabolite transporter (DMT)-like permease
MSVEPATVESAPAAVHGQARDGLTGTALILLSSVGYGAVVVLAKVAYDNGSNAPTSLFVRFSLAGLLLWGILLARRQVVRLPGRRIGTLLLMGWLFSAGSVMSFMAVERIPASLAALIFYLNPVIVTVFSTVLFKTRFTRARLAVLIASLVGCALTTNIESGEVNWSGVALAFATVVLYSGYVLLGARATTGIPALNASAWVITAAAGLMLITGLSGVLNAHLTTDITPTGWLALLALALFSTVIAITAFLAGIARIDLFRVAILSTFEPVISVTLAALLLGERLSPMQALGGAIIIGSGVAMQVITRREERV